jgi:hypothetical protein
VRGEMCVASARLASNGSLPEMKVADENGRWLRSTFIIVSLVISHSIHDFL